MEHSFLLLVGTQTHFITRVSSKKSQRLREECITQQHTCTF